MKRRLLAVFIALIPLSLTSCSTLSWKDLKTPAKFLDKAEKYPYRCWISIKENDIDNDRNKDYGLEVQKAMLNAGGFKKSDRNHSESYKFFNYCIRYNDGYIGLAPALYCYMSVYEDGFIQIKCDELNKDDDYAYFTMDAIKAYEINNFVCDKIPRDQQIIKEDREQAYLDGDIDIFISKMESKTSFKASLVEYNADRTTLANHNLTDDGQLLKLIKTIEHTRLTTSHEHWGASQVFFYNERSSDKDELSWYYSLYDCFDYVEIYYSYKNRLEEINNVTISYKIDPEKGKAIYNKALEIATVSEQ